jgi:hypothetical protein
VADLAERADRFVERAGKRPEEFVAAWRDGRIEDTADNARDALEALALREALTVTT